MAFDKPTRNRLAKFVADARRVIAEEFTEQFQSLYGISANGDVAPLEKLRHLDEAGLATAALLRERIEYLEKTHPEDKDGTKAAVACLAREQAFTILNRLAAICMAEKRGLIVESVGKGYQSKGFKVFETVAGSALGDTYHRYRRYLFCLFDELAVDLGILFDRRSPQALLFPREPALLALLDLLHAADLEPLWSEDETIGWIYQYYNDPEERKKMRKESAAPRNSRELAVRNQFFTPRYVVEFLTDNTLGRIWYEMTCGQTRLVEQCRYLVRRPTEIFLAEGETAPETPDQEGLSQEELLKQPVYIPHRPLKDPREIRLLDPACGSMHFGLYAFDLFETIYEEIWDTGCCPALQEAYASKEDFMRDVPRLIIEHNIHGIDIDPRAVQIAGLSLWLRAHKAWQARGIKPADRPRIRRSNIVCAEPMPGSPEMLEEFIATLEPKETRSVLGGLVKTVFDKMQLAGEAGSLLKIEEEIRTAIDIARKAWEKLEAQPRELFSTEELNKVTKQPELSLLEKAVTSSFIPNASSFWETIEDRLLDALCAYAEKADADSYQRRLFADDAARGFAFIDLCRKRYDAIVMNPPFGEYQDYARSYYVNCYPLSKNDLIGMFIERSLKLGHSGFVGAISSRTLFFLKTFAPIRSGRFLGDSPPIVMADLGKDVMDDAMVEAAAYVLVAGGASLARCLFINALEFTDRETVLTQARNCLIKGKNCNVIIDQKLQLFSTLENVPFCYWASPRVLSLFSDCDRLEAGSRKVRVGLQTGDDFRYIRCWWEVPIDEVGWIPHPKGGETVRFAADVHLCVNWKGEGAEIRNDPRSRVQNEPFYFSPGITSSYRCLFYSPAIFPSGMITGVAGSAIYADEVDLWWLLGVGNSRSFDCLIKLRLGSSEAGIIQVGHLQATPVPDMDCSSRENISALAKQAWEHAMHGFIGKEETRYFINPNASNITSADNSFLRDILEKIDFAVARAYGVNKEDFFEVKGIDVEQRDEGEEDSDFWLISYAIGTAFGRWDIRYATGERQPPELPDPFAPLPVCPPGMLQNAEGLPAEAKDVPADYPLRISCSGILVDDVNHPEDIVARVREAIELIWKDRAEVIEQEACEILGVKSLRDYFRRPNAFFADHLKRYSKSRRQAPIYWPLSTKSGSYTLWLYYHRLTDQTLHTCLADFLDPKIRKVQAELDALTNSGGSGTRARELREFLDELQDLRDEIERVIKLPWKPNLNDGVLITASPLHKLFRLPKWQKDLKACWDKLARGEFDWAHLAYTIWPQRVEKACEKDLSIAIAHGREDLCKVEIPKPKKVRGKKKADEEEESEEDEPELIEED